MQITFTGVPGEDHPYIFMYGHTFALGKPMAVADATAIRKLRNHPHFKCEDEAAKESAEEAPKADADFHSIESRPAMVAHAEKLGVRVDKRWSDDRLRDEISKAG